MTNEVAQNAAKDFANTLNKAFEQFRALLDDYLQIQKKYEKCKCQHNESKNIPANLNDFIADKIDLRIADIKKETEYNTELEEEQTEKESLLDNEFPEISAFDFSVDFNKDKGKHNNELYKEIRNSFGSKSPVFSSKALKQSKSNNSVKSNSSNNSHNNLNLSINDNKTNSFTLFDDQVRDIIIKKSDDKLLPKSNAMSNVGESMINVKNNKMKLDLSAVCNIDTTILSNGKMLKQSKLLFKPIEKPVNFALDNKNLETLCNGTSFEEIATVDEKTNENNIIEFGELNNSEDIIEGSPSVYLTSSKLKKLQLKKSRLKSKATIVKREPEILRTHKMFPKNTKKLLEKITKNKETNSSKDPFTQTIGLKLTDLSMITSTQIKPEKPFTAKANSLTINHTNKVKKELNLSVRSLNNITKEKKCSDGQVKSTKVLINQDLPTTNNDYFFRDYDNPWEARRRKQSKKVTKNNFNNAFHKSKDQLDDVTSRENKAELGDGDCWQCRASNSVFKVSPKGLQTQNDLCSWHKRDLLGEMIRPTPEEFWNPHFVCSITSSIDESS
ncbi:probable serine/threonine-protein kinase DDB_G0282963 [Prorops nasuta]|uniref:probable serine/threonine-protein kinase DDB_G0282963 n=1 Tax=Prorops nasuta TaxID=863751 RepID=UPI0034CDAE69